MKISRSLHTAAALALVLFTGAALAQRCNSQVPDAAPDSRYQMNANGTVLDTQTGLVWMRCALGQSWDAQKQDCTGTPTAYDWQGALNAAQTLDQNGFAGYKDWRLPNYRALTSIVRFSCHNPAINEKAFPGTASDKYWSSSPVVASYGTIWVVDFLTGHATYFASSSKFDVRLVRAGAYAP